MLFTKRAQRGTGQNAVDGVCLITRTKVRWEPSDPSKAQTAVLEISAITSELRRHACSARRHCAATRRRS